MSSTTSAPAPAASLAKIVNHETYLTEGIPSAASLSPSPLSQFADWFAAANAHEGIVEPEAFALSTVSLETPGRAIPSTRVVLLKEVDARGFVFYTNYDSRKGRELFPTSGEPAYASMAFYWHAQHRSIRVVGRVEKVSPEETEAYYHSRPVGSQVGAWASKQSTVLQGREELEDAVKDVERRFGVTADGVKSFVDVGPDGGAPAAKAGAEGLPVPPFWGGVRIVPFEIEFWMGRPSRLHDRFRYTREEGGEGEWELVRLSP